MKEPALPKTTLVVMNWNDLRGARAIIPRVDRSLFYEIFVMDGGSTDGSLEFFQEQGLRVNVQTEGGRGGAFRVAAQEAKGDYIVFLSTDGEEAPEDLKEFLRLFSEGADMVIGSRLGEGASHKAQAKWKWVHRMWFLKFITCMINVLFGAKLTDCWNGYRGFRLTALREINTDARDFLIEAQQTIRFLKANQVVREFPTHEGERIGGKSSNPVFRSGWGHLVLLVREKLKD